MNLNFCVSHLLQICKKLPWGKMGHMYFLSFFNFSYFSHFFDVLNILARYSSSRGIFQIYCTMDQFMPKYLENGM